MVSVHGTEPCQRCLPSFVIDHSMRFTFSLPLNTASVRKVLQARGCTVTIA